MIIQLLDAPGPIKLVDQVTEDLCLGRNVLLITPRTVPLGALQDAISAGTSQRERWLQAVSVFGEPADSEEALAHLARALGLEPMPCNIEEIVAHQDCPEVIMLTDTDTLAPREGRVWLQLLWEWAEQLKHVSDTQVQPIGRVVCLCLHATVLGDKVPASDINLSIRWWWNVPSALEVQLLCRLENRRYSLEAAWREHTLPSLAGNDVELVEHLWGAVVQPADGLMERLRQFASERGWDAYLSQWKRVLDSRLLPKTDARSRVSPPGAWRCFWDYGALSCTPEYGLEIHTAALALLRQRTEVEHRIWRGQAALLLPLLDSVRLDLCKHMSRQFINDWPLRWSTPENEKELELLQETPLATQWGYLHEALSNSPQRSRLRRERRVAGAGRKLRNELAHYRPVEYSAFMSFWESWRQFENEVLGGTWDA